MTLLDDPSAATLLSITFNALFGCALRGAGNKSHIRHLGSGVFGARNDGAMIQMDILRGANTC